MVRTLYMFEFVFLLGVLLEKRRPNHKGIFVVWRHAVHCIFLQNPHNKQSSTCSTTCKMFLDWQRWRVGIHRFLFLGGLTPAATLSIVPSFEPKVLPGQIPVPDYDSPFWYIRLERQTDLNTQPTPEMTKIATEAALTQNYNTTASARAQYFVQYPFLWSNSTVQHADSIPTRRIWQFLKQNEHRRFCCYSSAIQWLWCQPIFL